MRQGELSGSRALQRGRDLLELNRQLGFEPALDMGAEQRRQERTGRGQGERDPNDRTDQQAEPQGIEGGTQLVIFAFRCPGRAWLTVRDAPVVRLQGENRLMAEGPGLRGALLSSHSAPRPSSRRRSRAARTFAKNSSISRHSSTARCSPLSPRLANRERGKARSSHLPSFFVLLAYRIRFRSRA